MPEQHRKDLELARIMNALAESIDGLSEEDLFEEARAEGDEPRQLAQETRKILLGAVQGVRKQRLADARGGYERRVQELARTTHDLPNTLPEQLSLLKSVFARQPDLVTMQFRDLDKVTPEDVENLLKQLAELGVLDEPESGDA